MIKLYETKPSFNSYNMSHPWTKGIAQMWSDKQRCGGPITHNLNTES